jgi:hypothetical protein
MHNQPLGGGGGDKTIFIHLFICFLSMSMSVPLLDCLNVENHVAVSDIVRKSKGRVFIDILNTEGEKLIFRMENLYTTGIRKTRYNELFMPVSIKNADILGKLKQIEKIIIAKLFEKRYRLFRNGTGIYNISQMKPIFSGLVRQVGFVDHYDDMPTVMDSFLNCSLPSLDVIEVEGKRVYDLEEAKGRIESLTIEIQRITIWNGRARLCARYRLVVFDQITKRCQVTTKRKLLQAQTQAISKKHVKDACD